jgi:hypothetical protein
MKIIEPITITEEILTTDVENIDADWAAGTYNEGQRAVVNDSVYEALQTTTENPVGSAHWFRVGYSNIWRMWTEGSDSISTRIGGIDVTLDPLPLATAISLINVAGFECTVKMTDSVDGVVFHETKSLQDIGVSDWWEYYFTDYEQISAVYFDDLPPYNGAELQITISTTTETDEAACGRVVVGVERELGITLIGVQSLVEDYSVKQRDGFGYLNLVPRRNITLVDYDFVVDQALENNATQRLRKLTAKPTLFTGDGDLPETITFGVLSNLQKISNGDGTLSEFTLSIEEF